MLLGLHADGNAGSFGPLLLLQRLLFFSLSEEF